MLRFLTGPALVAALLVATSATAQTTSRPAGKKPTVRVEAAHVTRPATGDGKEAAPGTYQLVRLTNKRTITITTDALTEIERRRHATDEVSWLISPYAKVRILPRLVIEAPGFQPIAPVAMAPTR